MANTYTGERRTAFVVLFSLVVMLIEGIAAIATSSMALLGEAVHSGAHVVVLSLSWGAYRLAAAIDRRKQTDLDGRRVLSLAAFTGGVLLVVLTLYIVQEAVGRLVTPADDVDFAEALTIALVALAASTVCAIALKDPHHHHVHADRRDYNRYAAFVHVMSDAISSIGTIIALTCGALWGIDWLDSVAALVCALIIVAWAKSLLVESGLQLIKK